MVDKCKPSPLNNGGNRWCGCQGGGGVKWEALGAAWRCVDGGGVKWESIGAAWRCVDDAYISI